MRVNIEPENRMSYAPEMSGSECVFSTKPALLRRAFLFRRHGYLDWPMDGSDVPTAI